MAILGAVLGDILGAQYEFDRPKELKGILLLNDGKESTNESETNISKH